MRRATTAVVAGSLMVSACAADPGVVSLEAAPAPVDAGRASGTTPPPATDPTTVLVDPTSPPTAPPTDPPPVTTEPAPTTAPPPTLPPIIEPELFANIPLDEVVDVGDAKPARNYDDFVAVAFTDIERWWSEQFPVVYGDEFVPLTGGVYAGYPERTAPIPGCGEPSTRYEDLLQFVAFYCQFEDFMVYDDGNGDQTILAPLAEEFGAAVLGIVLAHEYGHAIQGRIGALDQPLATILTEQQADCFAGAWTGQAYRGESELLRLGDADVRAGLIAMLSVRDPVGTNQFVPGGHGSAFDRVGAFQEGFTEGATRCGELLDEPLTLVPNEFRSFEDQDRGGDASYDCSDDPNPDCTPAPVFLAEDLDDFWATALDEGFDAVTVAPVDDLSTVACDDPVRLADELIVCPSTNTVAYDEPAVVDLYVEFGDFTLGYFYGIAWAELAQLEIVSGLDGEARALLSDCFTGAWVRDITPASDGTTPRQGDRDDDGVLDGITSSPGDLDEAIQMAILEGDVGANVNVVGSPFEKIAAFRVGVLGGLDACQSLL